MPQRISQSSPPRPVSTSRKSLSPSHASRRQSLIKPNNPRESLLAPLTGQLHALKARNASLESSLRTQAATSTSELLRATGRIRNLEEGVEEGIRKLEEECQKRKEEAEGWESEAKRLTAELDKDQEGPKRELEKLRSELQVETGYKRR